MPDTKSWTWVLARACPECGLDVGALRRDELVPRLAATVQAWSEVLRGRDLGVRPSPEVWSPLEYGCHVRDVYRVNDRRLAQMLAEDDPGFADWDQDATAEADRYAEQDPAGVRAELLDAGGAYVARCAAVSGPQWQRPGRRSDGAAFTVESSMRYVLHDPVHHLHDVGAD